MDQSAGRQFSEIAAMVKRHPYLRSRCSVGEKQLVFHPTGSTLTALAVDAAGNAGANHLTASHTEAWGIVYEAGIRVYEELTPPPGTFYGDFPPMRIADSYAGFLGESNTWHALVDRGLTGEQVSADWPLFLAGGLLLIHAVGEAAQARCFRGTSEQAKHYYDDQRAQLRDAAYRRQHLNERTNNESRFITDELWAACYSPDVQPVTLADAGAGWRRMLVLGADASTTRDLTALVGCLPADEERRVQHAYTRVWRAQRSELRGGKPTIDLDATIGAEVLALQAAGLVLGVMYDPYQLHSVAVRWQQAGVRVVELPQNAGRIEAD